MDITPLSCFDPLFSPILHGKSSMVFRAWQTSGPRENPDPLIRTGNADARRKPPAQEMLLGIGFEDKRVY
jgi:hypothetical protein